MKALVAVGHSQQTQSTARAAATVALRRHRPYDRLQPSKNRVMCEIRCSTIERPQRQRRAASERQHGAVPNVENVDRLLFSKHDKQETVGTTIAGSEEKFADGLIERRAFGGHRAALRMVG